MPTYRNIHSGTCPTLQSALTSSADFKVTQVPCGLMKPADTDTCDVSSGSSHLGIQHTDCDSIGAVKHILKDFLVRLRYQFPHTPPNADLRREVTAEILLWNTGLSQGFIEGLTETACVVAECAYVHTTYEHQLLIAMYTAYLTYTDDQGQHNLESVGQFVQRYVKGERQTNVALDRLASFLGTIHDYFPSISADAIIANTFDAFTGMYIELVSQGGVVGPDAARYPYYLRLKAGISSAYAHFIFTKRWGEGAGVYYLQMLPELELVIVGINDILSFYKECLAGETDNYIHMRAAVERKQPILVLRELVEEVLKSVGKIERLASAQVGLTEMCMGFVMGYVEFHRNARRYHMEDLEVEP